MLRTEKNELLYSEEREKEKVYKSLDKMRSSRQKSVDDKEHEVVLV